MQLIFREMAWSRCEPRFQMWQFGSPNLIFPTVPGDGKGNPIKCKHQRKDVTQCIENRSFLLF